MPEILTMPQRSFEWFQARMGMPTASNFGEIMAKGRGSAPSARRMTYMHKLLAERLSRELDENYTGPDAMRGVEMEEVALQAYEFETGAKVQKVGFVKNDFAGASPDGLVGDEGLVEVKCPRRHHYIRMALSDDPAADYRHQIGGQLWLSGRKWCDLVLYSPPLPLSIQRCHSDDEQRAAMAEAVEAFATELDETEAALRKTLGMDNAPPLDALEEMIGRTA